MNHRDALMREVSRVKHERALLAASRCVRFGLHSGAIALVWCVSVVSCIISSDRADANEVQAGVAQTTFVLPARIPLAGYSRRHGEPSRGVHDAVGVRALVIQDERTTAAIVSCDLLIIDEQLFDAVHRRLRTEGLPHHLVLLLAATHTHSGPGAYGTRFLEKISMGHFDQRVFDALVESITQTIVRAYAARRPSRIAYQDGRAPALVFNRMDLHGTIDDELIVSAFYPMEADHPLAILVSFSAHPTTLGAWNTELSADYPGALMNEVERQFPMSVCLFVAGSVGDQAPAKSDSGFARTERIGRQLAQETTALLNSAHPESAETLAATQEVMRLPAARVRLGPHLRLPPWLGRAFVDDDATLSVLRVGTTVYFGVPCDLAADLGHELKTAALARGLHPMVIGFTSDYIGYCLSESQYHTGRYEALMAFNGPHTGALIVERLIHMLDQQKLSSP